jgi:hypothetical protein
MSLRRNVNVTARQEYAVNWSSPLSRTHDNVVAIKPDQDYAAKKIGYDEVFTRFASAN